jgi:hypothetical protein
LRRENKEEVEMKFCFIVLIVLCSVANAQQQGDVVRVNT